MNAKQGLNNLLSNKWSNYCQCSGFLESRSVVNWAMPHYCELKLIGILSTYVVIYAPPLSVT